MSLEPVPAGPGKKLWLRPEAFLAAIHRQEVAAWALRVSQRLLPPRVAHGPGERPRKYTNATVLLMAVVQTAGRMSYATIVDYVHTPDDLAGELGLPGTPTGQVRGISQGQYEERQAALGILPWLLFFLALGGQLVRLGVVTGRELLVDVSRLQAWWHADAAYFNYDFLSFIHIVLGASVGVDYNLRRKGKQALTTPFFLRPWRRCVLRPQSAIERHFAWARRYFGLKYFQCYTFVRVSQFVLLTYIVIAGVAVAVQRHQRPDLVRSRGDVLAVAVP